MPAALDIKFDNKSESQTHYVKSDGRPADSMRPAQYPLHCTDPFSNNKTSHQIEYTPKEIPDRVPRERTVYHPPTVPHNMSSTYHDNYKVRKDKK